MRKLGTGRYGSNRGARNQLAICAAVLLFTGTALGQTTLYFDNNGATSGLGSGTGTWNLTNMNWATSAAPGTAAPGAWVQGAIADFDASDVVQIAPNTDLQLSGIEFDAGSGGAGTPNLTVNGTTGPWGLDFGSNNFNIVQNTTAKQFIAAPIIGTGNMTINVMKAPTGSDTSAVEFSGNMSGFSGGITINNSFPAPSGGLTTTNAATLHIDTSLSGGAINLDEFTSLYSSSQVTGAGTTGDLFTGKTGVSPNYFTVANNIVLNYNAANENGATNVTNNIGGANGPSGTSKIEVFSGVISSPTGTTKDGLNIVSNLNIGGQSNLGTIVLANHETYNGSTTIAETSGNGMVQLAAENALPSTTALMIGSGSIAVGPTDLDGYDETVASLATGTSTTTATGVGNIYNLSVNNSSLNFQQNTANGGVQNSANQVVTLTISPSSSTNTVFNGDIGDSNVAINPLSNTAPYSGNTTANKNIALVINGPSAGGTHIFALAPVSALASGDEYTGTTSVNANATLVLGRTTAGAPGNNYTITGSGNVIVGNGAKLASVATLSGTYAGGAAGTIILQKGSSFLPGQAVISGSSSTLAPSNTGTLSTANIEFDSGASMTFDLAGTSSFDSVNLMNSDGSTGSLTLANPTNDAAPTYTINIDGGFIPPGTYDLITGNINGDQTDSNHVSQSISLNTAGIGPGQYKLLDVGNGLDLQVSGTAQVIQWDPTGAGITFDNNTDVFEAGGTWADGAKFVNLNGGSEVSWNNTDFLGYDVLIGNDKNQAGGTITLGEDITVGGALRIGPIYPGTIGNDYFYTITDGGSGHTLTLMGGVVVNTAGSTSLGAPSAVISAPVVLGANQSWEVDPSEFLDVEGSVNDNGNGYTLNVIGTANSTSGGTLFLNSAGSFGALNVQGGTVLLGNAGAIGDASVTLNGGALQYATNATVTNSIAVGANGGSLGATQQSGGGPAFNVTFTQPISSGNALTLIGSGNLTFSAGVTASSLTVNTSNTSGFGAVAINGNNSLDALNVPAGNVTIAPGTTNSLGAINVSGGALTLDGTNTITSVTISSGSVIANSPAALDATDKPAINLGPTSGNTGGSLFVPGFTVLASNINIGTNGQASEFISDTTSPLVLSGDISGSGNIHLIGPDYTLSGSNTNTNSTDFDTEGMIVHATSASAFGTSTILANADSTLDVQTAVTANDIRGAKTTASAPTTLTKTGAGALTLTGAASTASLAGSAVVINQGELIMHNNQQLKSSAGSAISLNITVNSGAILAADFTTSGARSGGSVAVNNASVIRDTGFTGDGDFAAASAADTWTFTGNSLMDNKDISTNVSSLLRVTNPVIVTTGSVLTIESDNNAGFSNNDALVFSGPGSLTNNPYDDFTIQAGATVTQTGVGEVRFGRTNSQGIAIIGQGVPGSESELQLTSDCYFTDVAAASQIATTFVVAGTGTAGLRIEAPMNANYIDPSTNPPASASIGTTGLFGVDNFSTNGNGNVFTVYSPNRAAALSSGYNDGTATITPAGTLTLAATDAAGATGLINAGPANPCAVSLALDNTASSGGTLVYQIDPAGNGQSFQNFAGLTLKRTYPAAAAVTGQLLGTTLIPALTITGGATLDIANQALAVDPGSNGTPALAQIAGYLASGYDHGAWDGPGINSSMISLPGTTIGYALNSSLPPTEQFTMFGGQSVSPNAVLVKYTWMGDLNLDGVVDSADLAMMGGGSPVNTGWIDGDLNYDGTFNADDWGLFMLGAAEQTGQLTSAVPEPSGSALLMATAAFQMRRRRRMAL